MQLTMIVLGIMPPPRAIPVLTYSGHRALALFDILYGFLLLWGVLTVAIEMLSRKPPLPDEEDDAPEVPGERR